MPLVSLLSNLFDDVSISVLNQQCVSKNSHCILDCFKAPPLVPLFSIFSTHCQLCCVKLHRPLTTRVMSTSPSCAPLLFGPSITPTHATNIAINALLYADDVAILGSAREVKQMLTLAESHSLALGYRWAPAKCAIINPRPPPHLPFLT
ncbi:PH domain-containing protein [Mucor velutinosus]|uniref:PH domain-containing protein n=1 Tax=Mucor velutinosus TaxID=708070 RepID=A0AAN7D2N3_9FUNG|nr:PH domain-containing protein [Mucor velutinosus]